MRNDVRQQRALGVQVKRTEEDDRQSDEKKVVIFNPPALFSEGSYTEGWACRVKYQVFSYLLNSHITTI